MAKRTFAIVTVFAALLSVTLSVQADNYNYYWTGASDNYYLTTGNWNVGTPSGQQATVGLNSTGNNITAYMYNTNGVITLHNNSLGTSVYSVNIGTENGTGSASLFYDHNSTTYHFYIEDGKTLSVNNGGTFTFAGAKRFVNNGTVNLNRGASFIVTEAELVVIDGANSVLNIKNGSTLSIDPITYIGTANNGATVNQTGGEATFNGRLALGWGDHSGYYNLSGGTLITTGEAGLWGANGSGISEFTVSGGTANFNKTGNSFEIGLGGSETLANKFTLQGTGIVNVADTFAVKNSGILNIEGGEFNAPTITVDSTSTINMTDGALKTNAINMNGGTFTQGGGSLVYNGKLTVTGNAVLNGTIDMSKFLGTYNQTVDVIEATSITGSPSISGDWTIANDGTKITATYTGGAGKYYWTGATNNTYNTGTNWSINGAQYTETYITGSPATFDKDCYILTSNGAVDIDWGDFGVASLTVGNGVGGSTGTAEISRSGAEELKKILTINKGGTATFGGAFSITSYNGTPATLTVNGGDFNANSSTTVSGNLTINDGNFNAKGTTTVNSGGDLTVNGGTFEFNNSDAQFLVKGDINVLSGNFTITSSNAFRIGDYAKGTVNIEGGTVTVKAPTYMGVGASSDYVGTINQKTGSTVTFENVLYLGWGNNVSGVYNLYGGTLNTNGEVGLWNGNANGVSTFNVEGGTANFNKSGESFTVGLGGTNSLANKFYLYSGTVNAKETFAVKYGGTLNVAKNGQTGGDGVLNAKGITLSNNGNLNMSSGTINLGSGGITNSGDYNITLSGGTFGTNYASWSSALTAEIESGTVTFAPDAGRTITWSGELKDAGGVTKTGAGTLELTGANTYSGGTTISEGTLAVNNANGLGTGLITLNGGTLDSHTSAAALTFTNSISVGENGGTVTTYSNSYSSFASISGSGDLTTNGQVHFNGTGGYNGHLTVNSGFTRIDPGAFGVFDLTLNNSSNFNVFNSGTIQIGKLESSTASWLFGSSGSNTYTFKIGTNTGDSDTASYSGFIRGSSASAKNVTVQKVGSGTQTFNASTAGQCTGLKEVIIDSGKMIINANNGVSASSTTGYWGNVPITVNSQGTLVFDHNWNTSPNDMLTVNGGTLTLNALEYQNKLTLNSATVNGNANGQLRVGFIGPGVWEVEGGTSTVDTTIVTVKTNNYTNFTINIADGAKLDLKKNIAGLTDDDPYKGTNLIVNGTGSQEKGTIKFNPSANSTITDTGTISFNGVNVEIAGDAGWLEHGYFNTSAVTLTDSKMTISTDHTTNDTVFTLDHSQLLFDGTVTSYPYQINLKNGSTIGGTGEGSSFRTGYNWDSQIITVYESGTTENVMNEISADILMYDYNRTLTFNVADKAPLTVSGQLLQAESGTTNIINKTGAGVLTLTAVNDLFKPVTISQGTLVLAENGTLGTSDVTINQNATLEFAHTADLTGDNAFSNVISGAGVVTKTGAGTLELSGANTFSGGITVSAGKLLITGNSTGTGKTTNNGAIVEFFADEGETITITNEVGNYTSGGVKGKTIKTGDGTLSTSNWISGLVEVQEGTLKITEKFSSGRRFNGEITIDQGAKLDCATHDSLGYSDSSSTKMNIYGLMDNSEGNESLRNTAFHMYGGTAQSSSGGTFDILNSGVKFYSHALTGATPEAPTESTISSKLLLRHNNTLAIDTDANTQLNLTGEISGRYKSGNNYTNYTGSITKTGEGTLVLSHRNPDYYGVTTISEGTVIANAPQQNGDSNRGKSVFGTGNVVVASGATLDFQATNQFGYESPNDITIQGTLIPSNFTHVNNVTLENGVIESENGYTSSGTGLDFDTRTVTLASSGTSRIDSRINVNKYSDHLTFDVTGALTVNGVIREGTGTNAGGGFIKAGAGTLELTADNVYTGTTTISAGTIKLSGSGDLGSGNVVNNATLDFAHTADFTGDNAFANVISGTGVVNKTGSGKLTLSGANTYTGMTNVNAGVLELTGDAVVANGPITVANDGTLEYNVASGKKKKLSIDATNKILSTGQVIKTGEGTLQLYSEAQGLIDISSLTVSSGQVDLKGYMTGGITVDANAVFSPGNSVGEATFGGGYILKEGATLLIEQDSTGIDKLNVGSFTFQEDSIDQSIELDITGIPFGAEYEIIKSNTAFSGDYLNDTYWLSHLTNELPEYMTLSVRGGNTVVLSINRNAVPEPSTWALLILGAAGMLYWRKRKNNK